MSKTISELHTDRAAKRAAALDDYNLASEVSRHAAVAARHLSYAELAEAEGKPRVAGDWRFSARRAEGLFLAEVDEVRARLAKGSQDDLARWLALFGATELVAPQ